jgi:sarcosine oxidase gamma subunit
MIDHGASLYFHHNWPRAAGVVHRAYRWDDHALKPYATRLAEEGPALAARLSPDLLAEVLALVPDEWLDDGDRDAYLAHLSQRAERPEAWLP